MSDLYTAAQEAERAARWACRHPAGVAWPDIDELSAYHTSRPFCLAAAAACEALSAAITRCDHDCLHQTRSDIVQAIADDFAARAQKWRKVAGGET